MTCFCHHFFLLVFLSERVFWQESTALDSQNDDSGCGLSVTGSIGVRFSGLARACFGVNLSGFDG